MFEQRPMRVGDWFLYHLILMIQIVNIIMFFVFLFSSQTNKSLKSLIILQLIFFAIVIAVFALGIASLGQLLPMT